MNIKQLKTSLQAWSGQALRRDARIGRGSWHVVAMVVATLALVPATTHAQNPIGDPNAVVSWGQPMVSAAPSAGNRINNQTAREIAHLSIGGSRVRVKLSNRWNPLPLTIGAAQVALRTTGSDIDASSSRPLTFSGSPSITIPPFGELVSDWVALSVPDLSDAAVDIFVPGDTSATGTVLTVRNGALQTNYVSTTGNFVGSSAFPQASTRTIWTSCRRSTWTRRAAAVPSSRSATRSPKG